VGQRAITARARAGLTDTEESVVVEGSHGLRLTIERERLFEDESPPHFARSRRIVNVDLTHALKSLAGTTRLAHSQ